LNPLQSSTITQETIPFSCHSFNKAANYNLAYILFTSGSTGIPKGVCIEHQNLLSFVTPATQQLFCHPNMAIPHSVNTIFDVSLMNMFTPLINGGQLLHSLGTDHLLEEQVQTCTHLFLTSAVFNCFGKKELEKLKNMEMLMVGGETPASENIKICIENGVKFMQIYGPTETTIWSMTNMCRRGFENGSVLGKF
jgi:non-ribosomal peptide synthetase component F